MYVPVLWMYRCINQYVDIVYTLNYDNIMYTVHLIQYTHHVYCMHNIDVLFTYTCHGYNQCEEFNSLLSERAHHQHLLQWLSSPTERAPYQQISVASEQF